MRNLTTGAVALILLSSIQSNASELNWSFKSPAFHYGNGYSTHVLSVEQLQHNRREDQRKDAEEIVDGLIDLCVVAIGTLDAYGVDPYKAWDEVLRANMDKFVGIKEGRPNPLGVPDLAKPEDWEAPNHLGNHGKFNDI